MQATTGYDISPAGEWLLDNFPLIEAQLEAVHAGLPRRFFQALPALRDEPLAGRTRGHPQGGPPDRQPVLRWH